LKIYPGEFIVQFDWINQATAKIWSKYLSVLFLEGGAEKCPFNGMLPKKDLRFFALEAQKVLTKLYSCSNNISIEAKIKRRV